MSKCEEHVSAEPCVALGAEDRVLESYPGRELSLGSLTVSRPNPVS